MRLAVLIDGDNASAPAIGHIFAKVSELGTPNIRRIYGDFTSGGMAHWRPILLKHAIQPVQQFRNTAGKSVTDCALIVDAMDLLHTRKLDGFCIVSGDGDFTRLVTRIRDDGLAVYGFGARGKVSNCFVVACSQFIPTETLISKKQPSTKGPPPGQSAPVRSQGGQDAPRGARSPR